MPCSSPSASMPYQRPPSFGSMIEARAGALPIVCVSSGHQAVLLTKVLKARARGALTMISRVTETPVVWSSILLGGLLGRGVLGGGLVGDVFERHQRVT